MMSYLTFYNLLVIISYCFLVFTSSLIYNIINNKIKLKYKYRMHIHNIIHCIISKNSLDTCKDQIVEQSSPSRLALWR